MKATLEFELPLESHQYECAVTGVVSWDTLEWIMDTIQDFKKAQSNHRSEREVLDVILHECREVVKGYRNYE